jgi:hypothetical protein
VSNPGVYPDDDISRTISSVGQRTRGTIHEASTRYAY